ncbi:MULTISPECIES: BTAD domain-containing putative transcriptional regulator [unclassified Streptomyces]|uniref:AfsR/SARP family transcriptional regulator n=1 Tax=unclassified Streptomyces TaxID=2593676 RepID=UPI0037FC800A
MRRYGLRFGLLGPPVLYDPGPVSGTGPSPSHGHGHDLTPGAGAGSGPGQALALDPYPHPQGVRGIRSPKARVLLAALLLDAGRIVPVDALKEALWRGAPPASAQASLHNHVTRLRRLIDDPGRLRAVPPGYRLRVEHGELDVHLFEAHLAVARRAHAAREWRRVLDACAAALALWRGTPLSGLPADLGGYAFVQRLDEARLLLLEWRYDAELAVGCARPDRLVPELAALTAEHPLREAFHRQLMAVLHRGGRRAEALAVHRDLRTRLVEELGIEPGSAVREVHMEVLRGEPETPAESAARPGMPGAEPPSASAVPSAVSTVPPSASAVPATEAPTPATPPSPSPSPAPTAPYAPPVTPRPAQLPPPPAHFTGRADTVRRLHRALAVRPGEHQGAGPLVVSGMAGVGKSALALHVAHALKERFSDGQLYLNLHGATPGMTPLPVGQALGALLRDLGTDPRSIPEHPDTAAALLRTLLAPTRTLLVLDDAAHAAQVRPLLPAGPGCAVIVTSRSPLTALDGAHRFPLGPLSAEDSAALLRAVSGRAGLRAGHPLVGLTGRLPLALRVVAARLAARRALTPDALAGQLTDTGSRLSHLEYDDLSVRRSLAVAHDALAASDRAADRDAALTLRRIGALDLPSYGVPLLVRLTGTDLRRTEAALDRLVEVALLEEVSYGRYAPHDLVRDYARELAEAETGARAEHGTPAPSPAASRLSALHWYAAVAERVLTAVVAPGPDRDDRRVPTSAQPPAHAAHVRDVPPFDGPEAAFAWADGELENIVALVSDVVSGVVGESGGEAPGEAAADAAGRTAAGRTGETGDTQSSADAPPRDERRPADDRTPDRPPSPVDRQPPDTPPAAEDALVSTLLRLLFPCLRHGGRLAEMDVLGRAALRVARRLGDAAAEAYALGDLAALHFLTGRQKDALALNDRALEIWRRLDGLPWIRRCLNNRGLLLEGLGRYAESEEALSRSLGYSRQLGDRHGEAVTRSHLGNLYEHTDPRAAIEQHRLSLALAEETGAVLVRLSAHCNIGYAHLTLGEPAAARPHFEESLRLLGGHGDWHGESQTRLGLVRALRLLGRTERADAECEELLARADARGDRYTGGLARHQRGLLLSGRGAGEAAREEWRRALAALEGTDEQAVLTELRALLDTPPGP